MRFSLAPVFIASVSGLSTSQASQVPATSMQGLPPLEILDTYEPTISNKLELEAALTMIKTTFETKLKKNVNLSRVSAPMFLSKVSGFNDNLNGIERPATFAPRDYQDVKLEVPFSLAKWKRWALNYYEVPAGQGLVTDMRGLRCDDDVDYTHSLYVDQFDWEKHITVEDRNEDYLKETVRSIYAALYETEQAVAKELGIEAILPEEITFVSSDVALKEHPELSAKEREDFYTKQHGAVFFMGIGGNKEDGELRHDGRAPDYDDWITERSCGGTGLNGDIIVWNPLLQQSLEISSMGIRVNPDVMRKQLDLCDDNDRLDLAWHKMLLDGTLPQTIGGGIGQSRLCQYMLRCAHIGEVQHGWYDPDEVEFLKGKNCNLLGLGEF